MENIERNAEALKDMKLEHKEAIVLAILQDVFNEHILMTSVVIRGNRNAIINALLESMESDENLYEMLRDALAIYHIRYGGGEYEPSPN